MREWNTIKLCVSPGKEPPSRDSFEISSRCSTLLNSCPLLFFYVWESNHPPHKNAESLVVASKETELEVNAEKTKYMVMSRDQNAGRSHSIKMDNSSFERVEEFKYLGTTLTNQNSIQEKIKIRLKSGNACYYSVQNILSSSLLSKNLKIKIYIEL